MNRQQSPMDGRALILLLDAVVKDDDARMRALIARFPLMAQPELAPDELQRICPFEKRCNHFYVQQDGSFGLVVEDTPPSRALASERDIEDYIFWGPNSDPVTVVTVAQVAEAMQTFEQHATPVKVIAVLQELCAA